jgi:hypothetical protein
MAFNPKFIQKHAEQFDSKIFKEKLVKFTQEKLNSK